MKDLGGEILTQSAINPQLAVHATPINGVVIDRKDFESGVFTFITGATTGSPTSWTAAVKLQECATSGGTYADIADKTLALSSADPLEGEIDIRLVPTLRYIRAVETVTFVGGTSPTLYVAATVSLGEARNKPV